MQRLTITTLLMLCSLTLPASARHWMEDEQTLPGWSVGATDLHLGCTGGACLGYGDTNWAEEVQVSFLLPDPPNGGPWKVEYVAFYMAGSGDHLVYMREGTLGTPPGLLLADDRGFIPVSESWPPSDWTYVLLTAGSSCPEYLPGDGGDVVTLGVTLTDGDAIGLASPESDLTGWGYYDGAWSNDSESWNLVPAIRLGLSDLGLSAPDETTWGQVKRLFAGQAP